MSSVESTNLYLVHVYIAGFTDHTLNFVKSVSIYIYSNVVTCPSRNIDA